MLFEKVDAQLSAFREAVSEDVPAFNEAVAEAGTPLIQIGEAMG